MFRSSTSPTPLDHHQNINNNNNNYVAVDQLLPTSHPMSQVSRKDKRSIRSAENAIHFIPLLLVFCTIVLWFFSGPVDIPSKGDHSLVAGVTSLITNGDGNTDLSKGVANGSNLLSEDNQGRFDIHDRSEDNDPANYESTG